MINNLAEAESTDITKKIMQYFINRRDAYAVQQSNGTYIKCVKPLTEEVLQKHLAGELTVGIYQLNPSNNKVKWLCFDIDPKTVTDPQKTTLDLFTFCKKNFIEDAIRIEASRHPDLSYHLWIFFADPVPADIAKYLGKTALKTLKIDSKTIEVFPKQTEISDKKPYGNLVKLPLGLHQEKEKWSCFLNETFQPLPSETILTVQPAIITPKQISQLRRLIKKGRPRATSFTERPSKRNVEDVFTIPCIKIFQVTPIPPGKRHLSAAKNFTILYHAIKGWDGFEEFAERLVQNQPGFETSEVIGWKSWVEEEQRGLNCVELSQFLSEYVSFNCEGCPIYRPIVLSHINMIEDPDLAGRNIIVEAVVSSTSVAYLMPTEIEATFEDKDHKIYTFNKKIDAKNPMNLKLIGVNEDIKFYRIKRFFGEPGKMVSIEEKDWRTVYRLRVRPPIFTLEKRGDKIVDERGFEYKAYDIYVTTDKPLTFHPSALIRIEGKAVPNPRNQKTTLLAYNVEFPENIQSFNRETLLKLKEKFRNMTVKERKDWILLNFEIYSRIIGRQNLAMTGFLSFFTPIWINFNGDVQRGWGNVTILGDTTTAKSETMRKIITLLKAGIIITAETASAVGLTGTATQIESGWFVDWGLLVLCDLKLIVIDGAHKMSLSGWTVLGEAERSGVVKIGKAAKNEAYARTRQVKIANPVDREKGKYETKNIRDFLYPCQTLNTFLDKTSIARLDLASFADSRDVTAEEINKKFTDTHDKDLELLSEALRWCWSDTAEVQFTEKAMNTLLNKATELYNTFFTQVVPIVSIDLKWKIARLSVSLAYMTLSTEDFNSVIVTEEHVNEIVNFLTDEYVNSGLNILAQATKHEVLTRLEIQQIVFIISQAAKITMEEVEKIFEFIVLQGRVTRNELKTKFSLSENRQMRPLLATLSNEKLIRTGKGFYPEPKLIQIYKRLITDEGKSIGDVLALLLKIEEFNTDEEFIKKAEELGLNENEAMHLFETQKSTGQIAMSSHDGSWKWLR